MLDCGLKIDYSKQGVKNSKLNHYNGSFAYAETVCSKNGKTCARIIQLHNKLGYKTDFTASRSKWTIEDNVPWFRQEMKSLANSNIPIFINLHYLDAKIFFLIFQSIKKQRPIFVLFSHFHDEHSASYRCINHKIPFIFSGSVPKNRFVEFMMRVKT
ncbi:unnamed protein product [Enterobius vermicularis]|uniref:PGA_cap domain-containing protein n=1 Tax=Enterobius vermicularis TaxID=51028 RepID=A0A158QB14_ENTVE|nr:unnamed protein product [Enterobius vermicularis]